MNDKQQTEVLIIGAGLTGLTAAFYLKKRGKRVLVVEKNEYAGGSIKTYRENGYVFESGPNTGSLSRPEAAELFEDLSGCSLQLAKKEANKRLVLKNGKLRNLPCGIVSGFFTPLFTWKDKFRILAEPFRKRGTNPDESVAELTIRRLGKSYLEYAADPFISGIYAGDPYLLTTRFAIPKLYSLEQTYGSFIRGAMKKAKEPKTEREKKATRKVFSVEGGLENLISALVNAIGKENIILNNKLLDISGIANRWTVKLSERELTVPTIISTVGSHALPAIFPFAATGLMENINNMRYAKIVQISIGLPLIPSIDLQAFGALVPSKENRSVLGVLFPSACFDGRAPEGKVVLSVFMGGIRQPHLIDLPDSELENIALEELKSLFNYTRLTPEYIKIFRHYHAIPQYEKNTGERLQAIDEFQKQYQGIILAGNLRDGIGMADRIKQAANLVKDIVPTPTSEVPLCAL